MPGGFINGGFNIGRTLFPVPYGSGSAYSAEAQDYFNRVVAAGGTVSAKDAIATYIDALVALGGAYWDTMGTSCLFVGVSFDGCFVPLRNGMDVPTNVGPFLSADHSSTTGLTGNGTTKYIISGRDNTDDGQDDASRSVYLTSYNTSESNKGVCGRANDDNCRNVSNLFVHGSRRFSVGAGTLANGFVGVSRAASTGYDYRSNDTTLTRTVSSVAPSAGDLYVFSDTGINTQTTATIATYHFGPALDLEVLEGLQDTLIASL